MIFGVWRMAYGVWRMAYGVWRMAYGVWRMVKVYEDHDINGVVLKNY